MLSHAEMEIRSFTEKQHVQISNNPRSPKSPTDAQFIIYFPIRLIFHYFPPLTSALLSTPHCFLYTITLWKNNHNIDIIITKIILASKGGLSTTSTKYITHYIVNKGQDIMRQYYVMLLITQVKVVLATIALFD